MIGTKVRILLLTFPVYTFLWWFFCVFFPESLYPSVPLGILSFLFYCLFLAEKNRGPIIFLVKNIGKFLKDGERVDEIILSKKENKRLNRGAELSISNLHSGGELSSPKTK